MRAPATPWSLRAAARPKLVHVGAGPIGISLISATHTIYVVNSWDDTISVLDATTCNDMVTWSCGTQPRLLRTGGIPLWLTTDQATDTLYTPNATDNDVSVLNGATCNAMVTSGCAHFFLPAVDVGSGPQGAIVDQVDQHRVRPQWQRRHRVGG